MTTRYWEGNSKSVFVTIGANGHSEQEREKHDYYATDPIAIEKLLKKEIFKKDVWECACGEGHLSKVLMRQNYNVRNTDIVDRGFANTEVADFLQIEEKNNRDIITNPPYKFAKEFVHHALSISQDGTKIAMLLKLQFLEGQNRRKFFEKFPPLRVYVFSKRIMCAKNGNFEKYKNSAMAYAWYIWIKGVKTQPVIKWI